MLQVAVPKVRDADRLLLAPMELKGFFKCVMRYGYMEKVDQVRLGGGSIHDRPVCLVTGWAPAG